MVNKRALSALDRTIAFHELVPRHVGDSKLL